MADLPPTTPSVLETFERGLDSPWQSPESRRAWVHLFLRDMTTGAAVAPLTDEQRAAIVAALLDGHEGVLAEATYRAEMGPRWSPHRMDETGQRRYREDHAKRVVAALRAQPFDPRQPHGESGLFQHEPGAPCVVCDRASGALCGPTRHGFDCVLPRGHNTGRADVPENHLRG